MEYDDGRILCDERGLVIRWYALFGAKTVPYSRIRAATAGDMSGVGGRNRIWGSSDLRHWYNLDATRPRKKTAIVLDLGKWVRPVITPDEPEKVIEILRRHGVDVAAG
jgi:hypothetical protein